MWAPGNNARAVSVSTESGAVSLRRLCFRPAKVLPLPVVSNVEPPAESPQHLDAVRNESVTGGEMLIGHFGRFMEPTRQFVLAAFEALLERDARVKVLLIGECGARYRADLLSRHPEFTTRVFDSRVREPWNDCGGLRLMETLDPERFSAELSRLALSSAELAERSAAASVFYHEHFSSELP